MPPPLPLDETHQRLRWMRRRRGTLAVIVGLAFLAATLVATLLIVRQEATCTHQWAVAYTQRQQVVTRYSNLRVSALDRLVRDLVLPPSAVRVAFPRDLRAYIAVSDAYERTLIDHPLPVPTFNC